MGPLAEGHRHRRRERPGHAALRHGLRTAARLVRGAARPLDRRAGLAGAGPRTAPIHARRRQPARRGCDAHAPTIIASPQDCGLAGGEYCAIWLGPELPGDQRVDDAKSVCFDSEPLDAPLDIVGAPVISLTLSADRPRAMVAVRLCDVQPDGASTRITYGVLNLCHRDSHEFPRTVVPGEPMQVALQLDDIAYAVQPGHRLRVAISSTYWPLVWPSPEPVALTLAEGAI